MVQVGGRDIARRATFKAVETFTSPEYLAVVATAKAQLGPGNESTIIERDKDGAMKFTGVKKHGQQ
jgi:hypothetical protein